MDKKIIISLTAIIMIIIVIAIAKHNRTRNNINSNYEISQNENAITELYQKAPEELTNDEFIQKAEYEKEIEKEYEDKDKVNYGEYDIKE